MICKLATSLPAITSPFLAAGYITRCISFPNSLPAGSRTYCGDLPPPPALPPQPPPGRLLRGKSDWGAQFREPLSAYHEKLLDMLRTVADMLPLPDCEFILHPWDHAKACSSLQHRKSLVPVNHRGGESLLLIVNTAV